MSAVQNETLKINRFVSYLVPVHHMDLLACQACDLDYVFFIQGKVNKDLLKSITIFMFKQSQNGHKNIINLRILFFNQQTLQ